MAVGKSGRIVIDLDPGLKATIYGALKARGVPLRSWFLDRVAADLLPVPAPAGSKEHDGRREGR